MSLTENIISIFIPGTISHLFLAVAVLYFFSGHFRYYFKFLLFILWISLGSLMFIPFMIFRPRNEHNFSITIKWCKLLSKLLGIDFVVIGKENLPNDNDFSIVVYNHQSFLDFLALSEIWPNFKKATSLSKKEVLYYFPFGLCYWLCGGLLIDRAKGKESFDYLNSEIKRLRNDEVTLIMSPEGKRSMDHNIKPFKTGAFRLAVAHSVPIVPVVISPYTLLDHKKRLFNSGKIVISILPAIQTKGMENTKESVEEVKNHAWKIMNDQYLQPKLKC